MAEVVRPNRLERGIIKVDDMRAKHLSTNNKGLSKDS